MGLSRMSSQWRNYGGGLGGHAAPSPFKSCPPPLLLIVRNECDGKTIFVKASSWFPPDEGLPHPLCSPPPPYNSVTPLCLVFIRVVQFD